MITAFFLSCQMSRFRSIGRVAFARGNSLWARNFNTNVKACLQSSSSPSFNGISPSTWRILSASQPLSSRLSTFALAAELPVGTGYAEQFRGTNPHTMAGPDDKVSEEALEEGDVSAVADTVNEINIQSSGGSSKTCWLGGHDGIVHRK